MNEKLWHHGLVLERAKLNIMQGINNKCCEKTIALEDDCRTGLATCRGMERRRSIVEADKMASGVKSECLEG
jgi:hypothetical protein